MQAAVNGIEMFFECMGSGPALVLLHGYPLDHSIWTQQMSDLSQKYQVIIPDLRGFGKSSAPEGIYHMHSMAEDVVALLNHLQVDKAVIAGHSMGGYIALAFAMQYPDRLAGLGLVCTQSREDDDAGRTRRYETADAVSTQGSKVVAEVMPDKLVYKNPELSNRLYGMIMETRPVGIIGALKGMAERENMRPNLARIDVPVEIIASREDALIPPERSQEMAEMIPHAHLTVFEECGHMPMMEKPSSVSEVLHNLMQKTELSGL